MADIAGNALLLSIGKVFSGIAAGPCPEANLKGSELFNERT